MPQAHIRSDPSPLPIERPCCPKCHARMTLARIGSGPNGSDVWIFQGSKREQVHKILAEDLIESTKAQWHNGRLASPT
jgi:hypothetical protein